MRRKGFTLVELMGVIVVIAIIALIATPMVTESIKSVRKKAFKVDSESIEKTIVSYATETGKTGTFTVQDGKVFLEGVEISDLKIDKKSYIGTITVSENGETNLAISNGSWCASKESETHITVSDYVEGECELKGPISILSHDWVSKTGISRNNITYIGFWDSLIAPDESYDAVWDVSENGDGSVMAWLFGTELAIGGNGKVYAPEDSSYLLYNFRNVTTMDLTFLDTSKVTNMDEMFCDDENLTTLDLSSFDLSSVTSAHCMFDVCNKLDTSAIYELPNFQSVSQSIFSCET